MAHATTSHAPPPADKYYVPHSSPWPIIGSVSLFITVGGAAMWLNHSHAGPWVMTVGFLILLFMFAGWFGAVIKESEARFYNDAVDRSFRMGMMWFIFSEVMFFAAFFGALWYARNFSVPWLGGEGTRALTKILRGDNYEAAWPTDGPGDVGGDFDVIPAFGLPAINTAILLTSGITITIAHHAIKAGNRAVLNIFLAATFLLGFLFVYLQGPRVHRGLSALQPEAEFGHLRLDVLPADGLPWLPRHHGRDHAAGDLVPLPEGTLHADASLRVRRRGLVLALRRRGVAGLVRVRVLAVTSAK
jgi:cytochrome c oxidase subunit III